MHQYISGQASWLAGSPFAVLKPAQAGLVRFNKGLYDFQLFFAMFIHFVFDSNIVYFSPRLSLAWNTLGMESDSFSGFCRSLELNGHLQVLDLSNNELSPSNGKTLSESLKNNGTLKSVDLRSNHLGLSGGSSLLKMLKNNNSISTIQLSGNQIPPETMEAIGKQCFQTLSFVINKMVYDVTRYYITNAQPVLLF